MHISVEGEHIEHGDLESEWTTITVADRGPGIPESEASVLEDDDKRTDTEHGSGLGLWITKQVMEIFGGRVKITLDPESEFSTEVRLWLQPEADATV